MIEFGNNKRQSGCGFTLVEFVVTILILSIVSAVVLSRFIGSNSFNALIIRDQVVSLARIAQQGSLGRSDVELTVTPSSGGDEVTIEASDAGGTIESVVLPLDTVTLSGDINDTDSCDSTSGADTISNSAPMTVAFGELGDLEVSGVTGSTGAITSALRICVNDDSAVSLCFSPSGFAYEGDCDV